MFDSNLAYYAGIGAALFPLPAGQKTPGPKEFWEVDGRAGSFKHHFSTDPEQWQRWRAERPLCNFGLVAFASGLIICDIDTSGGEVGQAEAWQAWTDLCLSWGLPEPLAPYCQSARGGWHVLCKIPPHIDPASLRQPDAVKKRINLRVIGYTVAAGSTFEGQPYQLFPNAPAPHPAPQALLDHCAPKTRDSVAKVGMHDKSDVGSLLCWLDDRDVFDPYEDWLNAGMALKLEFGDAGKDLWAITHNETVTPDVIATKWESFASEPTAQSVTLNSFFDRAHKLGWTGTVRPSASSMFAGVAQLAAASSAPGMPTPPAAASSTPTKHLRRSGAFVRGFVPPDYLVDGILQRRFCYSLTAQTGVGKTTVAMLLAAHVAIGKKLGNIDVERGTVIYFAGENPTDVQMRWLGLTREMGLDPESVDVIFVEGTKRFSETAQEITQEIIDEGLSVALVVVDTTAAFFEGDNDNDNVQMGNHARMLRSLTLLPGGPCVLMLSHPTKNATDDQLVPRGGGAFLNEVDGNIALVKNETTLTAFTLGKFRGPEFTPINFALKVVRDHPTLVDTKGRQIPTIIAEPISAGEQQRIEVKLRKDEDKVLELLCNRPGLGTVDIAKALEWKGHAKASIILKSLAAEKLVVSERKLWSATPRGQKAMNMIATAAARPVEPYAPPPPADLNGAAFPLPRQPGPPMPPA